MSVISDIRLLKKRQSGGCLPPIGWHGKSQPGAPVGRRRFRGHHGRPGGTQLPRVFFYWPSLRDSKESWGRLIG